MKKKDFYAKEETKRYTIFRLIYQKGEDIIKKKKGLMVLLKIFWIDWN